jgi:hypothetical protein
MHSAAFVQTLHLPRGRGWRALFGSHNRPRDDQYLFHLYVRDPLCIWKFYVGTITFDVPVHSLGGIALCTVRRESIEYEPRAVVTICRGLLTSIGVALGRRIYVSARRVALSMTIGRCPGQCSMTTSKCDSSIYTISFCSTFSVIRDSVNPCRAVRSGNTTAFGGALPYLSAAKSFRDGLRGRRAA